LDTEPAAVLDGQPIDTLIVPGSANRHTIRRDPRMIDWLRARAPDCARISSVCSGAFALAAAKLLRGRRVVTHWLLRDELRALHPEIAVEPDAIYVRDGKVWTAAGAGAGIDLALALIEHDLGRSVSLEIARLLVVYLRRTGGQSQCSA